jgi:hypothetical protein
LFSLSPVCPLQFYRVSGMGLQLPILRIIVESREATISSTEGTPSVFSALPERYLDALPMLFEPQY